MAYAAVNNNGNYCNKSRANEPQPPEENFILAALSNTSAAGESIGPRHCIKTNDCLMFDLGPVSALEVARQLAGEDDISDDDEHFVPALPHTDELAVHEGLALSKYAKSNAINVPSCDTKGMSIMKNGISLKCNNNQKYCDKIDDDSDNDDDGSSCLGSSVSCSEASFELARAEDFEQLHSPLYTNTLQSSVASTLKDVEQKSTDLPGTHTASNQLLNTSGFQGTGTSTLIRIEPGEKDEQIAQHRSSEGRQNNISVRQNGCLDHGATIEKTVSESAKKLRGKNVNYLTEIDKELARLDTALPQLNFDVLEKHLTDAVREREKTDREILSEEVRRRLAFDYASDMDEEEPSARKQNTFADARLRGSRSKLKAANNNNMEICFVNDGIPSDDDDDDDCEDDYADDWLSSVPKSFSVPNLGCSKASTSYDKNDTSLERSVSASVSDSEKRASELRRDALARQALEDTDLDCRKSRLELEAKIMLTKAKQAARMQMEIERQSKLKRSKSVVEEIVGIALGRRKLTRAQLSKMCITQLLIIINDLHARIQNYNAELVHLLIERDTLHMEQDSMLVDVQDLLQHQRKDDVKVPDFVAKLINSNSNGNLKKQFNFKLLKKVIPFSQNTD